MNKKILKIILSMCLLVMLLLYTGAEENLTNTQEGITNYEGNITSQIDSAVILNSSEINQTISQIEINQNETFNETSNETILQITHIQDTNQNITENKTEIIENILPIVDSLSESGTNSGNLYEENVKYLDLSNITQNNTSENLENLIPQEQIEYTSLQIQGKKEIDVGDYNGSGITKKEFEKNEFEKEVTVSSEEHFEGYLRVYTSLGTEAKKEDIKIYWRNNENTEITANNEYAVEYYDEDNNGLIDRISWIVPHLSEQIFDIVINTTQATESLEQILLNINSPPNGVVNNPIPFNILVNYTLEVNCSLKINENVSYFSSSQNYSLSLPNGNYDWAINCSDLTNNSIRNSTSGNFSINANFYSSLQEGKLYFLDLVKNEIKNSEAIIINSTNPSSFVAKIIRNGQVIYSKIASNYTTIVMNSSLLNSSGIYNLSVEYNTPSPRVISLTNFSVASANVIFNTSQIQEDQSIKISVSINSPIKKIAPIILDYGDLSSPAISLISTNSFSQDFTKKYSKDGIYLVNLTASIDSAGTFTIQKNGINVTNSKDDEAPVISLENPEDEEIIYEPAVNFSYKASDDIKIQNCTFKLYQNCASMSYCSTSSTNLLFPTNTQQNSIANNYSVLNNKKVEIKLQDFEDGIYEWLVECYDNSSNYNWEIGFFQIAVNGTNPASLSTTTNNYTQKNEVEDLKRQADAFITKNFNLEEREVLEDLSIINNTKYYKKRLIDIGDFFSENYKYVSTQALRDQKTTEYLAELENIKNRMPQNITITENYDYIKNSIDSDLESIIKDYFASTNTNIGKSSVQKLAKINREIQNEISISAKIKNVEIKYGNETQKITFVKKEITLKNESYNKILEVIPKDIAKNSDEVTFITSNKIINKDPLFEINYEDLDKKEIVYYVNGFSKLKDFENTETLLFEDNLNKFKARFTGFFVVDFVSGDSALYLILAFILLVILSFVAIFVFKKFKMLNWKKEPNVVKVLNLIEEIEKLLKEKEIEKAREKYYKIKEIYPVLPSKTKAYFYEKINEVLVRIDRKDIFGLVKEYQEAKRNWNKEDYMRLYEDIKKIYIRLPEKDRKKVYDIINGY